MGLKETLIDIIQSKGGEILQALLQGLKVKSYHGLTITIKSDPGFKFKLHDKKVKGKSGDKVISDIPVPIDIKIKINPNINIMMGEKKKIEALDK